MSAPNPPTQANVHGHGSTAMDAIHPEPVSNVVANDRRSSLSSSTDKKSPPVNQYDLDPEKVGSIRRDDGDDEVSDDDEEPTFWQNVHDKHVKPHWRLIKIFLWVLVFMTMTASVPPLVSPNIH
jgi:hypothetical protein